MAYAVLSLTVIRMLPVAVALTGARLGLAVLFIGWFGPRGLASVVFGCSRCKTWPSRRQAWRRRKSLMTTDQVLPGQTPQTHRTSRRRCPRAGRYAVTSGRRRQAAAPPGRVRER